MKLKDTRAPRQRRIPTTLRLHDFPGVGAVAVFTMLFLYVPILITTVYAFNAGNSALIWQGFSVKWFGAVAGNAKLLNSVWISLQIALIATVIATVFSILFALSVEQLRKRGSVIATAILSAPLVVPEIVLAVATLGFIRLIGLTPGMTALILAHTSFCIPFALMPIRGRLRGLGPSYFEAATDLGATSFQVFWRVTLPLLTPGIMSGAMLAFIISLDDFIISNFLSAAGATPLPVYLFSLIRRGASPEINVVATMLLILAVIATVLTFLLSTRRNKQYA